MTAVEIHKHKYEFGKIAELQHQLAHEGYTIIPWHDRPGRYYGPHSHPHDEYIVVASGNITFTIDQQEIKLEAGDALTLPAHIEHAALNDGAGTVNYFICTRTREGVCSHSSDS
ncbi:MAG TPA: cupin domain-containing protein [Candidatus Obscuribacterales bacterium]